MERFEVSSSDPGPTPSPAFDRLTTIVTQLLGLQGTPLAPETRPSDVPGWDSLANVNIVFAVEEEFEVEFTDEELKSFGTIGEFASGVDAALARGHAA